MNKHSNLLNRDKVALLIIDVQERLLPAMYEGETLIKNIKKVTEGFNILNCPIFYTEQYPQGLGKTIDDLKTSLQKAQKFEKISFSVVGAESLVETFIKMNIKQIVIAGIETHICVLQSALDLQSEGFQVYVMEDAVTSRKEVDKKTALRRINSKNIDLITVESVLFEILEKAGTQEFKEISRLIR